ncbi:peptidoglycan-binding domain-containing protein [Argonema galeatum]|uniref:peptidoglycan-binding domain-containing protein n=1 Tax=Argonema galeatum TaxID=2942762 RepID=UPI0020126FE7|nr:peptidoglycan-binding domain-containing protein [Argonema galeatum]MCL1463932.1 peptidoglycan-binding protein [Argonema galeatum A003/A1]
MSVIKIEEFSREFYETEKDGKIVSGGYNNEVGLGTTTVPPKIKEAVDRGDFRILDSYPPQGGKFALIGREIDKYSVLAVATSLREDGSRPGVCYRYFWLEKPQNENIDGIGTLLLWWEKVVKPKFEFNWQPNNPRLDYFADTRSRDYFIQSNSEFKDWLPKIKINSSQSQLALDNNGENISYKGLHYLAIHLHQSSNFPISWAWNVKELDKKQKFTIIYYTNSKIEINRLYNPNSSAIVKRDEPIPPPGYIDWQPTRDCLSDLAKNENINQNKLSELVNYLQHSSILQWNWSQINDQKIINQSTTPSGARYKALRAILGGEEVQGWLDWLRKTSNQTFQPTSLTIQAALLKASHSENTKNAYNQLVSRVNEGISQMLLQCTSPDITNNQYDNIEWLLFKSNTVLSSDFVNYTWSSYLQGYAKNLVSWLSAEDTQRNDDFYKQIRETLSEWDKKGKINGKYPLFPEYKKLALLFEKCKNYDLSAVLYQLSEGDVPEDISKNVNENVNEKIIRLRKRQKKANIYLIGVAVLIAILALAAGMRFAPGVFHLPNLPQAKDNSAKNNFILPRNFERDLDLWDNTGDPQAKQRLIQFLKDELPEILKDKDNDGNNEGRKKTSIATTNTFIKNAFTPTVSLSKDNPVKSDSPPDDIKIIQQMLNFIKYTSNSEELQFYTGDGEITGQFDQKTTEAIKNFQRIKMKLNQTTGTVGPDTWKKLQDSFKEEQVKPVKEFLRKSFEEGTNDNEIKQNINKLKSCKEDPTKAIEFIPCLKENQKILKKEDQK